MVRKAVWVSTRWSQMITLRRQKATKFVAKSVGHATTPLRLKFVPKKSAQGNTAKYYLIGFLKEYEFQCPTSCFGKSPYCNVQEWRALRFITLLLQSVSCLLPSFLACFLPSFLSFFLRSAFDHSIRLLFASHFALETSDRSFTCYQTGHFDSQYCRKVSCLQCALNSVCTDYYQLQ